MAFFYLPQRCTIQSGTATASRSGQKIDSWTIKAVGVKCLFYPTAGSRNAGALADYDQTSMLYLESSVQVNEGDRIIDISGKGKIQEAGPYLVTLVKKVTDLRGNVHHQTLKLKGVTI